MSTGCDGIAALIWAYCVDLPNGAPVDPFQTATPSAARPASSALTSGGVAYYTDPDASSRAAANRAALASTIGQPVRGLWAGEVTADEGESVCEGITGLHENTFHVVVRLRHQRKPVKDTEPTGPESRWELSRLLTYLRTRFLQLPTLAGQLACVAPDGVTEMVLEPDEDWHGVPVHVGSLRFDAVERELLTLTWS